MDGKIAAYRHAETMGKSQLDLILMVYDGALKAFRTASDNYRNEDNDAGYDQLQRAKKFITHLYTTLDVSRGGEVAENLARMYVWVISQVYVIEASHNLQELDAVTGVVDNLRSGWAELKNQANGKNREAGTPLDEDSDRRQLVEKFATVG